MSRATQKPAPPRRFRLLRCYTLRLTAGVRVADGVGVVFSLSALRRRHQGLVRIRSVIIMTEPLSHAGFFSPCPACLPGVPTCEAAARLALSHGMQTSDRDCALSRRRLKRLGLSPPSRSSTRPSPSSPPPFPPPPLSSRPPPSRRCSVLRPPLGLRHLDLVLSQRVLQDRRRSSLLLAPPAEGAAFRAPPCRAPPCRAPPASRRRSRAACRAARARGGPVVWARRLWASRLWDSRPCSSVGQATVSQAAVGSVVEGPTAVCMPRLPPGSRAGDPAFLQRIPVLFKRCLVSC